MHFINTQAVIIKPLINGIHDILFITSIAFYDC
jgi:hypothetical protein